ncbi:TPA: DUF3800 domain-containing protein [Vibrio alginolyticus]
MYFYVDESGQTGLELFDENQPFLYYGVLSSKLNVDVLVLDAVKKLREKLHVERLHAAELGNGRLIEIVKDLEKIQKTYDIKFDLYRIAKADHSIIAFFDQVFDQGVNPAITWTGYWTPMRYVLLLKVAYLFDEEMAKEAWTARITVRDELANKHLINVCNSVLDRVHWLPDQRSKTLISDALKWVVKNPSKILYNAASKKDRLQISPNLIGFQSVLHGIASRLEKSKSKSKSKKVIVDRQSQFNKAQKIITEHYQNASKFGEPMALGPGLPIVDYKHMPTVPIECTPGTESVGLELVDIYIWIFKRHIEGKDLAPQLYPLIKKQLNRGMYDEVSIDAISRRWEKWFSELPEPSEEQLAKGKELLEIDENRRQQYVIRD